MLGPVPRLGILGRLHDELLQPGWSPACSASWPATADPRHYRGVDGNDLQV